MSHCPNVKIKNIHRLVLKELDDNHTGSYRDQQAFISGAEHIPPEPFLLKEKIEELVIGHEGEAQQLHPVGRGAKLHASFAGTGVFGDEEGALKEPSIMPGGQRKAFEPVHPIFEEK